LLELVKTDSDDTDFGNLVRLLDADLKIRAGDENVFYAQFNKTDNIKHVIVAYLNNIAVGCGAIKFYQPNIMEVKRMYVSETHRGHGIASEILSTLEAWTKEFGFEKCILETGKKQPEAIALYKKNSYQIVPNYGQYINIENSICFEKIFFRNELVLTFCFHEKTSYF
jgi:GNAT superfamily N-acetyltransferase